MNVDNKINDLIKNFREYIELFKTNNPFSGPSEYFYINKIISITKKENYDTVFTQEFIEYIYATLASWGMHRMGPENKGAKMNDFDSFKDCIMQNKNKIMKLKNFKINTIETDDVISDVNELYLSFWPLMKSNSKLVATSKVMHFLLPHLIPPMDREYTMDFFNKYLPTIKSIDDQKNIENEIEIFEFAFRKICFISKQVDCSVFVDSEFSPTIPKVIDNAIVSYVREGKKRSRIRVELDLFKKGQNIRKKKKK
jgi:hypothetical protein